MLIKVEIIIRPYQTQIINDIINFENEAIIIEDVSGVGVNVNPLNLYKGQKKILESLPKSKITVYTYKNKLEKLVSTITEKIRTGIIGDGKIFIQEILNSIDII